MREEFRMQHNNNEEPKQPYEKPKVRVIELSAEEVLSVGCKTGFADPKGASGSGCLSGLCAASLGS
jgi:hypothetical protein